MKTSTLLLVVGLCLCSGISAQFDISGSDLSIDVPRFSRLLRQEVGVASYLLPQEPAVDQLCTSGSCCQTDSYASPYTLLYKNHTQTQIGGRYYSTFFYDLKASHACRADLDNKQCCTASVDTVWIDVDPTLKVKYVAINGLSNNIITEQNQYGLRIGGINQQFSTVSSGALPITVTVEGYIDQLCPPPQLAPVSGLCEVVVQGASAAGANACCPVSISRNSTTSFIPTAKDGFQCTSDMARSGFTLVLEGTESYTTSGNRYIKYNFRLGSNSACSDAGSLSSCCNTQLQYIEMKITEQAITDVKLGDSSVPFVVSLWNEPSQTSYRSLVIDNLNYRRADVAAGLPLTVTIRSPNVNAMDPDLCDASNDPNTGSCQFYLHSEDGLCCPSGTAAASGVVPPPPAGTCAPTKNVAASEASMSLQYYEKQADSSITTFTFLLANHNGATCSKPNCGDVCSWTLYINKNVATSVVVGHDESANNGKQIISAGEAGKPAEVTFTYGPAGESTNNFFVSLPASGRSLSDLCAPNALPGQGSKACAAIVRSKNVYIMVFFDENDIIIAPSPPPATTVPGVCTNAVSMDKACTKPVNARINAVAGTTTFAFTASASSDSTCLRASPVAEKVSVRMYLNPVVVDEISTRQRVKPSTAMTLDRNSGVTWAISQSSAQTFTFNLQGSLSLSDVCRQGVVSGQPAGSCAVEVSGQDKCFRAFITASQDNSLIWSDSVSAAKSSGASASTIVPAVVVPVLVVLAAIVAAALYYKRKRSGYTPSVASSDNLERPLAAGSRNGSVIDRDDLSVPSASPSDVQIRMAQSGGGAAPQ